MILMLKTWRINMGCAASSWIIDLDPFMPLTAQGWARRSPRRRRLLRKCTARRGTERETRAGRCPLRSCPLLALGEEWEVQKGTTVVTLVAFPPCERNTGRAPAPQPSPPIAQPENHAPGFRSRRGQSSRVPGRPSHRAADVLLTFASVVVQKKWWNDLLYS